ncbi:hypothetical protein IC582_013593 [Cucumis melo]
MSKSRLSKEFQLGVENFIRFGFSNTTNTYVCCPCLKCGNCQKHKADNIRNHLYFNGIDESYKIWFWHGEELHNSSFHGKSSKCMYEENDIGNIKEMVDIAHEQYSKDPSGFEKLLNDAEKPL